MTWRTFEELCCESVYLWTEHVEFYREFLVQIIILSAQTGMQVNKKFCCFLRIQFSLYGFWPGLMCSNESLAGIFVFRLIINKLRSLKRGVVLLLMWITSSYWCDHLFRMLGEPIYPLVEPELHSNILQVSTKRGISRQCGREVLNLRLRQPFLRLEIHVRLLRA